jgi:hypothetical protein
VPACRRSPVSSSNSRARVGCASASSYARGTSTGREFRTTRMGKSNEPSACCCATYSRARIPRADSSNPMTTRTRRDLYAASTGHRLRGPSLAGREKCRCKAHEFAVLRRGSVMETVGQSRCETRRYAGPFWAVRTATAPHRATPYRGDRVPQQDGTAAADPFSRANVDHFVKPQHFTIKRPHHDARSGQRQCDRAAAVARCESEARPIFLRTTSIARETTLRSTRAPMSCPSAARRPSPGVHERPLHPPRSRSLDLHARSSSTPSVWSDGPNAIATGGKRACSNPRFRLSEAPFPRHERGAEVSGTDAANGMIEIAGWRLPAASGHRRFWWRVRDGRVKLDLGRARSRPKRGSGEVSVASTASIPTAVGGDGSGASAAGARHIAVGEEVARAARRLT